MRCVPRLPRVSTDTDPEGANSRIAPRSPKRTGPETCTVSRRPSPRSRRIMKVPSSSFCVNSE